ncbi:MAG: ADOP family duplicated permease, partial [Acidobacteriota bacterium]
VANRLSQQFPKRNRFRGVFLSPLQEESVRSARASLLVLMATVGLVLLIACTNVANLLMGRAIERRREISVRSALGAGRWRLIRQMLSEALLLFLSGGALGLVLAYWAVDLFLALSAGVLPRQVEVGLNPEVLAYALGISLLSGLLFGLAPAFQSFRMDLLPALQAARQASSAGSRSGWMVSMEVAFSLLLLLAAGLMLNSFFRLLSVDPGFDPERLLAMEVSLPASRYPESRQQIDFAEQALERLRNLPGVRSASFTSHLPLEGDYWRYGLLIEGRPAPVDNSQKPFADYRLIDPRYFRMMGIPLLHGRGLNEQDGQQAPKVLLVNQAMARRFWPDEDPVGQGLDFALCRPDPCQIVGVVGDIKHYGLDAPENPAIYALHRQKAEPWMSQLFFLLRTSGDPLEMASAAKQQIWSLDRGLPFRRVLSMEQKLSSTVADRRLVACLLAAFALVALLLATVGVYGVISNSVSRRVQEIGIRMALGAGGKDVLWMVIRRGMLLTLTGTAIGLAGAYGLTRFLSGLLFGITATDPVTFAAVSLLLLAVAFLACYLPARRATRVDPLAVLRYE